MENRLDHPPLASLPPFLLSTSLFNKKAKNGVLLLVRRSQLVYTHLLLAIRNWNFFFLLCSLYGITQELSFKKGIPVNRATERDLLILVYI